VRVVGWIAAFVVVAALGAGLYSAAHRPVALTASHQPATNAFVGALNDGQPDPPHVIPAPSPSPSPIPKAVAKPPSGASAPARTQRPAIVIGSRQQQLINADRAARGLGPLSWSGCLDNVAVANARRIAAQGSLSHTNGPQLDLGCGLGVHAGENIGYWSLGINDPQLNTMFMNSPEHYANIMGPYHYVATAWVVASNGYGYIAVEFS
jgi:uncharacterized protein YkwD